MLKINKKLSKKIIFPLSSRGLFSFCHSCFPLCHSRESGNPSSPSLRAKQRSNLHLKGFSLIELMIAVAILAFAVLGIFQAYSVGFMGMADSRDRTVAVNYVQKYMEDIKNMNFETIHNRAMSTIGDTEFQRGITVIDVESDEEGNVNLKRVITQVRWKNRKGDWKTEESDIMVYNLPMSAEECETNATIVLYADRYNVLLSDGTSNITAVIKDTQGKVFKNWIGADISFSLNVDGLDNPVNLDNVALSDISSTVEGEATAIFTSSVPGTDEKYVNVKATVPFGADILTDEITIRLTNGPVKLKLTAVPDEIPADGSSTSTITATVLDAGDNELKENELENDIEVTFEVFGEGTLSPPTTRTITKVEGSEVIASTDIVLTASTDPGVATVIANAIDLDSGIVDVLIIGPPAAISVSAVPHTIYTDGESEVTVTVTDEYGNPVDFTGTINLEIGGDSTGDGNFSNSSLLFAGESSQSTAFTPTSTGVVIIEAIDQNENPEEKLEPGSDTIEIYSALIAHHITITANPTNIKAGDSETSVITATIKDITGATVIYYEQNIDFSTTNGTFSSNGNRTITLTSSDYENGVAIVHLNPADTVGSATVTASSGGLPLQPPEGVEVGFYGGAHHIKLTAYPDSIMAGGEISIITAIIEDSNNNQVMDYSEEVTFTITSGGSYGQLIGDTTKNAFHGKAIIYLESLSPDTAGTVMVQATSGAMTSNEVSIIVKLDISLEIVSGSEFFYQNWKNIYFDIDVEGGNIELTGMKVSWDPISITHRKLEKIYISSNTGSPYQLIYDGSKNNGDMVTFSSPYPTLLEGESRIGLHFSDEMIYGYWYWWLGWHWRWTMPQRSITISFYGNLNEYVRPLIVNDSTNTYNDR